MSYSTKNQLVDASQVVIAQYFDEEADSYKPMPKPLESLEAKTEPVTLQNIATDIGDGTPFPVRAYKTITLEVSGTSTSRTILFEGASSTGDYYPVMGVKMSDLSMATQTTGNAEVWQFDITGLEFFRARISSIGGGNCTIRGKAVS